MIIVEQEKTYLINFDNTTQITLAVDKEEKEFAVMAETTKSKDVILGIYKTEERAKEVLQEIMQCEYSTEIFKYKNGIFNASELNKLQEKAFVYEMPEE